MSVACTHHCRACGRHFHSIQAFDAHRRYEAPHGSGVGCLAPDADDEVSSEFIGYAGDCEISGAERLEGTVWELASRRGTVRARMHNATPPAA